MTVSPAPSVPSTPCLMATPFLLFRPAACPPRLDMDALLVTALGSLAAELLVEAIQRSVLTATTAGGLPALTPASALPGFRGFFYEAFADLLVKQN